MSGLSVSSERQAEEKSATALKDTGLQDSDAQLDAGRARPCSCSCSLTLALALALASSTHVLCFLQVALAGVWLYLVPLPSPLFFLPSAVRPRASRCLWTGLAIQLILASRRTALCEGLERGSQQMIEGMMLAQWHD